MPSKDLLHVCYSNIHMLAYVHNASKHVCSRTCMSGINTCYAICCTTQVNSKHTIPFSSSVPWAASLPPAAARQGPHEYDECAGLKRDHRAPGPHVGSCVREGDVGGGGGWGGGDGCMGVDVWVRVWLCLCGGVSARVFVLVDKQ